MKPARNEFQSSILQLLACSRLVKQFNQMEFLFSESTAFCERWWVWEEAQPFVWEHMNPERQSDVTLPVLGRPISFDQFF